MPVHRVRVALVTLALVTSSCVSGSTYTLYEENDGLTVGSNEDEHYTQGARASWVVPYEVAPNFAKRVPKFLPVSNSTTQAIGAVLGQEMYTPRNINARRLLREDRPYAGWLYAGAMFADVDRRQDGPQGDSMNSWELDVGVIGPSSRASKVHRAGHAFSGSSEPRGWDNQLKDEAGLVLTYNYRKRLLAGRTTTGHEWDAIGGVGIDLGNIRTLGSVSGMVRFGQDLPRDFGVNTIHRTATEVGPVEGRDGFRWYAYLGGEARGVAHNIFLDGNTFRDSHSVDRKPFVGEAQAGIAAQWGNFRVSLGQVLRSREFDGQADSQRFGSLALQYQLDF